MTRSIVWLLYAVWGEVQGWGETAIGEAGESCGEMAAATEGKSEEVQGAEEQAMPKVDGAEELATMEVNGAGEKAIGEWGSVQGKGEDCIGDDGEVQGSGDMAIGDAVCAVEWARRSKVREGEPGSDSGRSPLLSADRLWKRSWFRVA